MISFLFSLDKSTTVSTCLEDTIDTSINFHSTHIKFGDDIPTTNSSFNECVHQKFRVPVFSWTSIDYNNFLDISNFSLSFSYHWRNAPALLSVVLLITVLPLFVMDFFSIISIYKLIFMLIWITNSNQCKRFNI